LVLSAKWLRQKHLLRIIAGIYKPTSGFSSLKGLDVSGLQTKIVNFWEISIKEKYIFVWGNNGLSKKEIYEKYNKIIELAEFKRIY